MFRIDPALDHPGANKLAHKKMHRVSDTGVAICVCLAKIQEMLKGYSIPEDRLVPLGFEFTGRFRSVKKPGVKYTPKGRRLQQAKAVGRAYARHQVWGKTRNRYHALAVNNDPDIRTAARGGWLNEVNRLYPD